MSANVIFAFRKSEICLYVIRKRCSQFKVTLCYRKINSTVHVTPLYDKKYLALTVFYAENDVPKVAPGLVFREGRVRRHLHHLALLQELEC